MSRILVKLLLSTMVVLLISTTAHSAEDPCEKVDVTKEANRQICATEVKVESSNPLSKNCEAIIRGSCLYNKWCSSCHGLKADGENRFGKYSADLTKHWRGYGGYVEIVLNGASGNIGRMPPWAGVLNVEQINRIGAYLETLADEKKAYWK